MWHSMANVQPDAGKFVCPTCAARDSRKEEGDGARGLKPPQSAKDGALKLTQCRMVFIKTL